MKVLPTVLALIGILAGTHASAQFSPDKSVEIKNAWARIAPTEAGTVSVFFEVFSHRDSADTLISASSPAAEKVTLRRGTWKGLSFSNEPTSRIEIGAHKRLTFRPGTYEVTVTNFTAPLEVGMNLPITLVFRDAGQLNIQIAVGNQLLGNRTKK